MATFTQGDVSLNYEIHGEGFPVLLIAPGGMRSAIDYWQNTPWSPIEHLLPSYRVIAMDQRNAGRSTGPVGPDSGWHSYTADQLALLDHLGVDQFHVVGMCIGGPYIMGLIEAAPDRVASAVAMQPIGLDDNREAFRGLFSEWADDLRASHPEASDAEWVAFGEAMFGGDFLFNVSEDFVTACTTPLLVLMGDDQYHPQSTSRRIAELAPNATLIEQWKEPADRPAAQAAIERFLADHTPAG